MHKIVREAGFDTTWFHGASDLNGYLDAEKGNMLNETLKYLNKLGNYLLAENIKMFHDVLDGRYKETGRDLDRALVRREQGHVSEFTKSYFANGIPVEVDMNLRAAFSVTRANLWAAFGNSGNAAFLSGINSVIERKGSFYYFNKDDRIQLGYGMMDFYRKNEESK